MQNSVGALLSSSARRFGDKIAVVFQNQELSFAELHLRSSKLAAALQSLGIRRGERVSLYGANSPEWIISYYAVLKVGAVVNPLNFMLTPVEAAYAMKNCGARAVLGSADKIESLSAVREATEPQFYIAYGGDVSAETHNYEALIDSSRCPSESYPASGIDLDEPCTVAYTSGTTGQPKGAVLTHRAILMNTGMTATMHLRTERDVVVSALPCSHVYGNIVMNAAVGLGMKLVLHKSFDAVEILESIQRYRCTLFEGVPTMYLYLLNHPALSDYDLSSVSRCTVGGQAMPIAKMHAVESAFGCPLLELWGMTELGGLGTTHAFYGPRKFGSIGIPLPYLQTRIATISGELRALPAGEVGELQIRGPVTMREYLGNQEATEEAFCDGSWLRTGDLARMDDEGFIYIVDRLKDMIITAGYNIYPAELESVIAAHPDVAMVGVGSVTDPTKGELAKAYIVRRLGSNPQIADIERHCRESLAAYKVPRAFQFVDDLPKTGSGKILRRQLSTLEPSKS